MDELHPDFPWEKLPADVRTVAECALFCLRALRQDYRENLGSEAVFQETQRQQLHYGELERTFSLGLPLCRKLRKDGGAPRNNSNPAMRAMHDAIEITLYLSTRIHRGQKLDRNLTWDELVALHQRVLAEMEELASEKV